MKPRKWTIQNLKNVVKEAVSLRDVIQKLGLVPAGGNYNQIKRIISENNIDISHFTGKGWKKGNSTPVTPARPLSVILQKGSEYKSYKLKLRLWREDLIPKQCELCGWAQHSADGRLPLELDHINGDHMDNRLENLRILCPNCHSLQSTHRGSNPKNQKRNGNS